MPASDLRQRLWQLRRRLTDTPLEAARLVRTAVRRGLVGNGVKHPIRFASIALGRGINVRSVHALHAAGDPERAAIVDDHRTLTYVEADREIDLVAGALRDRLGVSRHAPVLVMMENRVEYVVVWFALVRLGVTCAHVSRHSTAEELQPLVERSRARVLVVSEHTLAPALAVASARPDLALRIVCVDSTDAAPVDYRELLARHAEHARTLHVEPGPSDNVVYTSGTTGRPKGAVRDVAALGTIELLQLLERLPLHAGDRHLVVAPLYHSSGQAFTMINSALGATIHLQEKFDPLETLQRLSRHHINNLFMVPTMIHRILELPERAFRDNPTPDLRALISGAAPFNVALREQAIARFGPGRIFDFYGATELGWVTLVDGHEMQARPGTLGRAIAGQEIAIMDEHGRVLPPGEVGQVFTRSAQLMLGYHRDDAATDASRRGEWFTVDDLGYLDEDGYLFLTGRARDMVISGGINIYPVEVENALSQHPTIRDIAVIGLPDEQWGERLVAIVVPGGGFDAETVQTWARGVLAPYKVPRRWETISELPRNPTGKVLKRELVARYG